MICLWVPNLVCENFLVQYIGDQKVPHQLSLVLKLSLEKLSVYDQLNEDVLHVTRVRDFISCSKPCKEQNWK